MYVAFSELSGGFVDSRQCVPSSVVKLHGRAHYVNGASVLMTNSDTSGCWEINHPDY